MPEKRLGRVGHHIIHIKPRAHIALLDLRRLRHRLFEKRRGDQVAMNRSGTHHSRKSSRQIDRWRVG